MVLSDKDHARKTLRDRRRQLDFATQEHAAKKVAHHIAQLEPFLNSKHIAYYYTNDGELDPAPTITHADKMQKCFYLPVLHLSKPKQLAFYQHTLNETLHKNRFGILEPDVTTKKEYDARSLDIILLPLVGFDEQCNRMGRGVGFYDRTLAFVNDNPNSQRPILIGLAYEFQKLPTLIPADWDVQMDFVVTEEKIYRKS